MRIIIIILLLLFLSVPFTIGKTVKSHCLQSQKYQQPTCVDNLIYLVQDETQSFRSRNSAIWTLGQLGNKKALTALQKYYTGNIPRKESLDKNLSQYELKKAINLVSGGINITAIFWRYGY
ncbi:MAG TPA: HEAT repeat domain-containing protein [Candidatus Woesebacteria bacterium]|nr:HEAT repeat domain-containing protein [Candidatus Woesebacteria bacterium]